MQSLFWILHPVMKSILKICRLSSAYKLTCLVPNLSFIHAIAHSRNVLILISCLRPVSEALVWTRMKQRGEGRWFVWRLPCKQLPQLCVQPHGLFILLHAYAQLLNFSVLTEGSPGNCFHLFPASSIMPQSLALISGLPFWQRSGQSTCHNMHAEGYNCWALRGWHPMCRVVYIQALAALLCQTAAGTFLGGT